MVSTQLSKLSSCSSLREQGNCDWVGCQFVEFGHGVLFFGVSVIAEVLSVLQLLFKRAVDTDLRTRFLSFMGRASGSSKRGGATRNPRQKAVKIKRVRQAT